MEFHLHGSPLLAQRFSDYLLTLGLRLAYPGEFTQRALLNGKQSLLAVEALQELMEADTDLQLQQAQAHQGLLLGSLPSKPSWLVGLHRRKPLSITARMNTCRSTSMP